MSSRCDLRATIDAVARCFDVDVDALGGKSRARHLMMARKAAYYVLRQRHPRASYPSLARMLGGRNHSTFINGCRVAERLRDSSEDFRAITDALVAGDWEVPLPPGLKEEIRHLAESAQEAEKPVLTFRQFHAEIAAYPEPKPNQLGIQLKGQRGCPGLSGEDIDRRRAETLRRRRAHEQRFLAQEQARYGLSRRGMALSEMTL